MKKFSFNILFALAFIVAIGLTTTVSADTKLKFPKNKGAFSIKTEGKSYPVIIDGQEVGVSGADDPAIFFLEPGSHTVELRGPNGISWVKEINVQKYVQECVCLKIVDSETKTPCPYDIKLDAPSVVNEGDLVTFATWNAVRTPRNTGNDSDTSSNTSDSNNKLVYGGKVVNRNGKSGAAMTAASASAIAAALNYAWKVSPDNAKITSGLGTNSITVNTAGMGGQTVVAELEVTDGMYDATCRQRVVAETKITKTKGPESRKCDEFIVNNFDDPKARFDNCVAEMQITPGAQLYIFIYQGTKRPSPNADRLAKRTLDYLVKARSVPPQNVQIIQAGPSNRTGYEIWVVPPGADLPTPTPNKMFY
jgi:hypothetical protein